MRRFNFHLPAELMARIRVAADGRPVAEIVRRALEAYLAAAEAKDRTTEQVV